MLRSRKNAGVYGTNCYFGCCREFSNKKSERRYIKRKENRVWKKEVKNDY